MSNNDLFTYDNILVINLHKLDNIEIIVSMISPWYLQCRQFNCWQNWRKFHVWSCWLSVGNLAPTAQLKMLDPVEVKKLSNLERQLSPGLLGLLYFMLGESTSNMPNLGCPTKNIDGNLASKTQSHNLPRMEKAKILPVNNFILDSNKSPINSTVTYSIPSIPIHPLGGRSFGIIVTMGKR